MLAPNPGLLRVVKLLLLMCFVAHIGACAFYNVGTHQSFMGTDWVEVSQTGAFDSSERRVWCAD